MKKNVAQGRPARLDADSVIREHGLRRTEVRAATLAYVAAVHEVTGKPVSHPELAANLSPRYDRASLFRALQDFVEAGILRRLELGDHVWRFALVEARADDGRTPVTFQCDECQRTIELAPQPKRRAPRREVASVARIYVRGMCTKCAKALERA